MKNKHGKRLPFTAIPSGQGEWQEKLVFTFKFFQRLKKRKKDRVMEGVVKHHQQRMKAWWGRRMSQYEWVGARAMSRTGERGCGQAQSSCSGSLQNISAPIQYICHREKAKNTKGLLLHKTRNRKLMVNGSRLSPASCTSGSFTAP